MGAREKALKKLLALIADPDSYQAGKILLPPEVKKLYHVTPIDNAPSIRQEGIRALASQMTPKERAAFEIDFWDGERKLSRDRYTDYVRTTADPKGIYGVSSDLNMQYRINPNGLAATFEPGVEGGLAEIRGLIPRKNIEARRTITGDTPFKYGRWKKFALGSALGLGGWNEH